MPRPVRVLLSWIGQGIVGGFAFATIVAFVAPSPARDAVLLLIWPLVIVAGTVVAWRWLGQSSQPLAQLTPTQPAMPDSAELTRLRALEDTARNDLRRKRLQGVRDRVRELIDSNSREDAASRTLDAKTEAYSQIAAVDRAVREILLDLSDELEIYERVPNIQWSALEWYEHVVAMLKIRRDNISEIDGRLEFSPR